MLINHFLFSEEHILQVEKSCNCLLHVPLLIINKQFQAVDQISTGIVNEQSKHLQCVYFQRRTFFELLVNCSVETFLLCCANIMNK